MFRRFKKIPFHCMENLTSNVAKSSKKTYHGQDVNHSNNFNSRGQIRMVVLTSVFLASYFISQQLSSIGPSQELMSIQELKSKDDYSDIRIINKNILLAKKLDDNHYYRVNIPNEAYFEKHIKTDKPVYFEDQTSLFDYVGTALTVGLLVAIGISAFRNVNGFKQIMEVNKSFDIQHVETTFKDIIGQNNAKRAISELVDILKNNEKYKELGVVVPKGALLSGPPGTGKTLLAKAVAGECNLPFVNMCGSDFNAMFVGVGSAKVRNLYESARHAADKYGGCIIFIDEVDAIGQKRNVSNTISGGHNERENTLNQLLTEMDGFDTNKNVLTIAATNRAEMLDDALLRPGRFDRKITVSLPTIHERKDLFEFYFGKLNMEKEIISRLSDVSSKLTPGFSGADVANVANESGIISVRRDKTTVEEIEVKDAIDYVMMGDQKEELLQSQEKTIVAYHEAGHAFLSYILDHVENPIKVSIIPREKGMLGFSQSEVTPEYLTTKQKMEEQIMVCMGGRAAEQVFCSDITNGASNDIEKASELATQYIKIFGFGHHKFFNQHNNDAYKNDISNYIKDHTDKEVISLLNDLYTTTMDLIIENKVHIEKMKVQLLEKNTIYFEDIENIVKKSD